MRQMSTTPYTSTRRGVAQFGSALALGARGRGFKSRHPDFDQDRRSSGSDPPGCAPRVPSRLHSIEPRFSRSPRSTPVKSTVETLSPTRVKLAIEVPFSELEPSLKKAYREIGAQVSIPGFRKGKVPTAVIDQRVGRQTILTEAVQDTIPVQVRAAVEEHDVRVFGRPEVEITDFADGQPLR